MALVKPVELTPGVARNQALTGRVRMLHFPIVGKQGKATDYAELHLLVEDGLSGALFYGGLARPSSQINTDCARG